MKTKWRSRGPAGSRIHKGTQSSGRERGSVLLCVALWCVLTSVLVHTFLYSSIEVVGRSMVPTLRTGDWRLVNRWRHRLWGVERGDLVVLREPNSRTEVVKRVIALPGDVVQIRDDGVYVNHRKLREPYLARNTYTWSRKLGTDQIAMGDSQYFVMGDNRLFSVDSRWYGPVSKSHLIGVVTF